MRSYRCKFGCLLLLIGAFGLIALPTSAQYVDFSKSKPQKGPFQDYIDLSGETPKSEQPNMTNPTGSILDLAMKGDAAKIETMIKGGVATDSRGEGEETALHWASLYGHLEVAELLLSHGADVRATDATGSTPLHGAAEEGFPELVRLLLDHKADPNAANDDGVTPLHLAAANGHQEIVVALLEQGAAINVADKSGSTPLHFAAEYGRISVVKILLAKGADAQIKTLPERQRWSWPALIIIWTSRNLSTPAHPR